jgi:cysteine desulfuration protein SufE
MADRPEKLTKLLDLLGTVHDRGDRIRMLIDIADRFKGVPEHIATRPYPEERKTPACESEAYMFAEELSDMTLKFHFAVENPQGISARAMAVILDEALSGAPPEQVARVSGEIVYDIFGRELSMGKNIGLISMVSMVTNSAKRCLSTRPPLLPRV